MHLRALEQAAGAAVVDAVGADVEVLAAAQAAVVLLDLPVGDGAAAVVAVAGARSA